MKMEMLKTHHLPNSRKMKAHRYSIETIHHFRCVECDKWWSIADFKRELRHLIFCPRCGTIGTLKEISPDEQVSPSQL